ncbi:MAG: cupin domain-containing protein [Chloroflexi bacterium]|nr:cupin domain-containing protein [Chloroflexota bacterium]
MELFKIAEYLKKANPEPGKRYTQQLLEQKAENLVGLFAVLPPGTQTPYHFHDERESVIIVISGQATELVECKRIPIQVNDVLFIPAKQKHGIENRTHGELRHLEFQVGKPGEADFVETDWSEA